MGLIDFILCPAAVILAVIAVIKRNGKFVTWQIWDFKIMQGLVRL